LPSTCWRVCAGRCFIFVPEASSAPWLQLLHYYRVLSHLNPTCTHLAAQGKIMALWRACFSVALVFCDRQRRNLLFVQAAAFKKCAKSAESSCTLPTRPCFRGACWYRALLPPHKANSVVHSGAGIVDGLAPLPRGPLRRQRLCCGRG